MKRFFAFALALIAISITALKADNDRIITFNQLPVAAQQFIKSYFPGRTVAYAKEDRELTGKTYELRLSDGIEIEFDGKGNWKDVDGDRVHIPTGFIPKGVLNSLNAAHPGDRIVKIERKWHGYYVELASGLDVLLNKSGKITGYDD